MKSYDITGGLNRMILWVVRSVVKYGTDEAETIFDVACPSYEDAVDFIELALPNAKYIKEKEGVGRPIESILIRKDIKEYYDISDYWIGEAEEGLIKLDIFPIEVFANTQKI